MKTLKLKLGIIISLAVAFLLALGFSLGLFVVNADRTVRITGSNIFITSGNAQVTAHKEDTDGYENPEFYTMFVLRSGSDAVNYRKNLAYSWYYSDSTGSGEKQNGFFNMEIGFEELDFVKTILTFESQQFSQTKDEKTTNYIVFTVADAEAGTVYAYITDNLEDEAPANGQALNASHISIKFTGRTDGEYAVSVSDGSTTVTDAFVNVGGTYAQYSSSSTTPVTPLSFKAEFGEGETSSSGTAKVVLFSLNGQSFRYGSFDKVTSPTSANLKNYYVKNGERYERVAKDAAFDSETQYYTYDSSKDVTESGGEYTLANGYINDDMPPVLCLKKGVSYIREGREISFDYETIDVLASMPGETVSYFMLTYDQARKADFDADKYDDEELFRQVSDSDDQYMLPHANHYKPTENDMNGKAFGENFTATAAVKVALKLTDTTSTGGLSDYVLLDWYVEDRYLLEINNNTYIAVATDESGAKFSYTDDETKTSDVNAQSWAEKLAAYQSAVNEAAKDLKAGSKNYFYLPSVESLLSDNATAYEDMTFGIYYKTDKDTGNSGQSVTSRKYNTLAINLTNAGKYIFTVFATDGSDNSMYYYKDGEVKKLESGDIWNMYHDDSEDNLRDYLPWFEFDVSVSEISIEDPGERDTAYVGTEYKGVSFDINGVSYDTDYQLYLFRNDLYYQANQEALTYDEFMTGKDKLFAEHREWFTNIPSKNDATMTEGSEEYEEYKDYEWNNSSLTFVPQDANAFYLVKLTVTSKDNGQQKDVAYMGISAAPRVRNLVGEDTWLQDNMTSVILLCIAGASLVGIVLLLVIKPKDKGDIDVTYEKESKKRK